LKATIESTPALGPLTMPPLSVLIVPLDPIESAALRLRTAASRVNILIGTTKKLGNKSRDPAGHRMCRTFLKRQVPRTDSGKNYLPVGACLLEASLITFFKNR